jgi:hypothetical protein
VGLRAAAATPQAGCGGPRAQQSCCRVSQ